MSEDKTKILEKIKKCLALSKSPNEHEAAAALRQAQKLMAMHDLSEEDVEGVDYVCADVLTDYEYGRRKPIVLIAVANLLMHVFGVEVVTSIGRKNNIGGPVHMIVYCGPRPKVHLAVFAHTVVWRAVTAAWKRHSEENPWVKKKQGARAGFYYGWCQSVVDKLEKLVPNDREKAGTAKAKERRFGSSELASAKMGSKTLDADTARAGMQAGRDFNIHQPIAATRLKIGVDKS